jgi:MoxR-like ATPase
MLCLYLDYPSRDQEVEILISTTGAAAGTIPEIHSFQDILEFQEIATRIAVSRELACYSADLVRATRPSGPGALQWLEKIVEWGAGPRAGQSILRIAKSMAAMDGRPAICADDVRDALVPALRHRISCNFRARAEGLDEAAIIARVLEEVPAP